jgi:hypothetical protein
MSTIDAIQMIEYNNVYKTCITIIYSTCCTCGRVLRPPPFACGGVGVGIVRRHVEDRMLKIVVVVRRTRCERRAITVIRSVRLNKTNECIWEGNRRKGSPYITFPPSAGVCVSGSVRGLRAQTTQRDVRVVPSHGVHAVQVPSRTAAG